MATLRSEGSSGSGTPGTTIATVTRTGSNKLRDVHVIAGQTNSANTQLRITITYTDSTTTQIDTVAGAAWVVVNGGGGLRIAGGVADLVTALAAKDVATITVATLGTGTGTRGASISAEEVA